MEESVCPECHKKIGGQDHVPAQNNTAINLDFHHTMQINNHNVINNVILNQDQQALNNMNIQHNANQEHQMDDDIAELLRQHPEMNEYN